MFNRIKESFRYEKHNARQIREAAKGKKRKENLVRMTEEGTVRGREGDGGKTSEQRERQVNLKAIKTT